MAVHCAIYMVLELQLICPKIRTGIFFVFNSPVHSLQNKKYNLGFVRFDLSHINRLHIICIHGCQCQLAKVDVPLIFNDGEILDSGRLFEC